jgi:protocatechuate 4,5-dioxygenase alpha chain
MSLYGVSRLLYDLREEHNREQFKRDFEGYARQYELAASEKEMVVRRDWKRLAEAGVSIYLLTKLAATVDVDFLEMEAAMRSMSKQEFVAFLQKQAEQNRQYALDLD